MGWQWFGVLVGLWAALATAQPKRILYLTHSAGYRHASIDTPIPVLQDLANRTGQLEIVATDDVSLLNAANLATFDAVLFFTSGELPVSDSQKADLLQFVGSGKGFAGVHSATDTFYTWPDYGQLIGARFNGHPWVQPVRLDIEDPDHPAMAAVKPSLFIGEEIYQFRDFSRLRSRVLMTVDPHSIDLSAAGVNPATEDFPSSWCHLYGQGRVFYTALGHFDETWRDPGFQQLLWGGLLWVTRQVDGDATPRNPAAPVVPPNAVANSASFQPPMVISAGSWFTIFGSNLTPGSALAADPVYKLAGAVVKVNGAAVPLNYASPTQINAYLPLTTAPAPDGTYSITVSATGGDRSHTTSLTVRASDATPGIFATMVQNEYATLWATGLGPVVQSGPFQLTKSTPVVRIGGVGSRVLFSGLAPGWLGLYQVNVELPAGYRSPAPVEFCFEAFCQAAGSL